MILRAGKLRAEPVYAFTESPRAIAPGREAPALRTEIDRLQDELERIGKALYRLGLGQEAVMRSLERLAQEGSPGSRRLAEEFLPLMDGLQRLARALRCMGSAPPRAWWTAP